MCVRGGLPRPKRPTAFCLVRELPLGPTGKVARHRLQELELQELELQELELLEVGHQALPSRHWRRRITPYRPLPWAAAATGRHSRQVASRDS